MDWFVHQKGEFPVIHSLSSEVIFRPDLLADFVLILWWENGYWKADFYLRMFALFYNRTVYFVLFLSSELRFRFWPSDKCRSQLIPSWWVNDLLNRFPKTIVNVHVLLIFFVNKIIPSYVTDNAKIWYSAGNAKIFSRAVKKIHLDLTEWFSILKNCWSLLQRNKCM